MCVVMETQRVPNPLVIGASIQESHTQQIWEHICGLMQLPGSCESLLHLPHSQPRWLEDNRPTHSWLTGSTTSTRPPTSTLAASGKLCPTSQPPVTAGSWNTLKLLT